MRRFTVCFCALLIALVPSASLAGRFAVVYADTLDVTLLEGANGINVLSYSWALIVNTGDTPITNDEWITADCVYEDADECMEIAGLTACGSDPTPILPGEAIGRIINHRNGILLNGLVESEVFRDGYYEQIMSLQVFKEPGTDCAGQLQYEVEWGMAGEVVTMSFVVNLRIGSPDIDFVSVNRVESESVLSNNEPTTWGGVKSLYR